MFYSISYEVMTGKILSSQISGTRPNLSLQDGVETILVDPYDTEKLDLYQVNLTTKSLELKNNYNDIIVNKKWDKIKQIRNRLLTSTDWTELASAINRNGAEWSNSWQQYREALRNITNQADPDQIEWPTPPNI